jgi:pimeloyl-ACP methyl ester carboxylesterase
MGGRLSLGVAAAYLVQAEAGEAPKPSVVVEDSRVRIAYSDSGGDGPVVLALHGSPGDRDAFRALGAALTPWYRFLAPDLPGFGLSTRRLSNYSIKSQAKRIAEMMERLGIGSYHVVGHSLGGGGLDCISRSLRRTVYGRSP